MNRSEFTAVQISKVVSVRIQPKKMTERQYSKLEQDVAFKMFQDLILDKGRGGRVGTSYFDRV